MISSWITSTGDDLRCFLVMLGAEQAGCTEPGRVISVCELSAIFSVFRYRTRSVSRAFDCINRRAISTNCLRSISWAPNFTAIARFDLQMS